MAAKVDSSDRAISDGHLNVTEINGIKPRSFRKWPMIRNLDQ